MNIIRKREGNNQNDKGINKKISIDLNQFNWILKMEEKGSKIEKRLFIIVN